MIPARRFLTGLVAAAGLLIACGSLANNLPFNGAASYQELGKERFIAALFLEAPSNSPGTIFDAESEKRMEIRLTSRYSKRRWINLWMQSMAINNSSKLFNSLADSLVNMFAAQAGSLKSGDVVAINYHTNNSCSYEVNGVVLASEQPAGLFKLFLNAWIGKVPPSSGFRSAILGDTDSSVMQVRLSSISPEQPRIAAVEAWLAPEPEPEPKPEPVVVAAVKPEPPPEPVAAPAPDPTPAPQPELAAASLEPAPEALAITEQGSMFANPEQDPIAIAVASSTQLIKEQQAAALSQKEEEKEEPATVSLDMILAMKEYTKGALKKVYKSIRYPTSALRRGQEGQVRLLVQVDRAGELITVEAAEESKFATLNKAAIKAVKRAEPFAAVPEVISDEPLELTIPISFRLQK